jgi:hypothetical protein
MRKDASPRVKCGHNHNWPVRDALQNRHEPDRRDAMSSENPQQQCYALRYLHV